jgi:hypothetical protein
MELVISTETKCPAGLMGRSSPIARMATEAGVIGAKVADGRRRSCTVKAREYLFEVLPQLPELLSEFVQCWLGRRVAFNARAVISSHLGLRFWPNSDRRPRSAVVSNAQSKCTPPATRRSSLPGPVMRSKARRQARGTVR